MKTIDFENNVMELEEGGETLRVSFEGNVPTLTKQERQNLLKQKRQERQEFVERQQQLAEKRRKIRDRIKEAPLEEKVDMLIQYLDL